jgi:Cep192 domain 4
MTDVPMRRRSLHAALITLGLVAMTVLVPAAAGAGGAPAIAFNPSSGDYGMIDAGTTASKTFVLRNSGSTATGSLRVTLTGSSTFSKTADTCMGKSLGPGKQCSLTVRYAPTTAGQSDSATLTAGGKKSPANASAFLTGASTPAGTPDLTISPGDYVAGTTEPEQYGFSFGSVTSQTQTFMVTNTGSGVSDTLLVSGAVHPNFVLTGDGCSGQALAAGGSCTFNLTYTAPLGCSSGEPVDPAVFDVFGVSGPPHYIHLMVVANCP